MARTPALPLLSQDPPDEEVAELGRSRARYRSFAFWLAGAAVAVIVGLSAAGFLGGHSRPETLYQRTMAIAGQYRCPVCAGESAASSDAPAAVEIRQLVGRWLGEGKSPAQIRKYLVADYGPSILEKPPASGLDSLIWALPALGVALGGVGLAVAFYRWRKAGRLQPASAAGIAATTFEGAAAFQLEVGAPSPTRGAWQRARRLSLPAGVALVAIALGLFLLDRSSSPELPGGTITGGVTGLNTELTEAQALASSAPVSALQIYQNVLASYPGQPIALAGEAWIYAEAGLSARALSLLNEAEKADPSYGLAHLYRGLVLLDELGRRAEAEHELEWYLSHDPSPNMVQFARRALASAKTVRGTADRQR